MMVCLRIILFFDLFSPRTNRGTMIDRAEIAVFIRRVNTQID